MRYVCRLFFASRLCCSPSSAGKFTPEVALKQQSKKFNCTARVLQSHTKRCTISKSDVPVQKVRKNTRAISRHSKNESFCATGYGTVFPSELTGKQSATLWTFNSIADLINEDKKNPVNKGYSISFKTRTDRTFLFVLFPSKPVCSRRRLSPLISVFPNKP